MLVTSCRAEKDIPTQKYFDTAYYYMKTYYWHMFPKNRL